MKFELVPILNRMESLYRMPKSKERFEAYLAMLQGGKNGEMVLPIAGYNPMGNERVLAKIDSMITLGAEDLATAALSEVNQRIAGPDDRTIQVVLNLVDDVGGAWSNFATTDYKSKFELSTLIRRDFCTPYLWTSETIDEQTIAQRTKEYAYRVWYWLHSKRPQTLEDHFEQEIYVQDNSNGSIPNLAGMDFADIEKFYEENSESEDYNLIFNFFYGDEASELLNYKKYGNKRDHGFSYATHVLNERLVSWEECWPNIA